MNNHLTDYQIQEIAEANAMGSDSKEMLHLKSCNECLGRYENYKSIFTALKFNEENFLPENFAESVIERIEETSVEKIKRFPKIIYMAINIAAAVVFAILLREINVKISIDESYTVQNLLQTGTIIAVALIVFLYIAINGYQKVFQRKNYLDDITL